MQETGQGGFVERLPDDHVFALVGHVDNHLAGRRCQRLGPGDLGQPDRDLPLVLAQSRRHEEEDQENQENVDQRDHVDPFEFGLVDGQSHGRLLVISPG